MRGRKNVLVYIIPTLPSMKIYLRGRELVQKIKIVIYIRWVSLGNKSRRPPSYNERIGRT